MTPKASIDQTHCAVKVQAGTPSLRGLQSQVHNASFWFCSLDARKGVSATDSATGEILPAKTYLRPLKHGFPPRCSGRVFVFLNPTTPRLTGIILLGSSAYATLGLPRRYQYLLGSAAVGFRRDSMETWRSWGDGVTEKEDHPSLPSSVYAQ